MSVDDSISDAIARKNRIRLVTSLAILACYFGFSFGWGGLGRLFASGISQQAVPAGIFLFFGLLALFLIFEGIYLGLLRRTRQSEVENGQQ